MKVLTVLSFIFLTSFIPQTAPKTLKVELTFEEAQIIATALAGSDNVSAKKSNEIIQKIQVAAQVALSDTLKKDTTKGKPHNK